MGFKKWASVIFCAAFILMLTLPLIFTNFKPDTVSEIEQRTLREFPALYHEDGTRRENFAGEFEDWFNDNVGFREKLFTMNATVQYDLFHSSVSDRVVMGTDGWLFYVKENNLSIAAGEYPGFDENVLADICQKQQFIQNALAAQGIEYVILLPPSKLSIYPEYLPGNFEIRDTPADILADYLEEHSTVKVVRLKQALLEEKEAGDGLLYYKTDTHWNAYGAYISYCESIRKMNEWGIIGSDPVEVDFSQGATMRDLARMIVNDNEKYYEYGVHTFSIQNPRASSVQDGEKYEKITEYAAENQLVRSCYYLNPAQPNASFLVLCDSMFMFYGMPELFAENSSELIGVWSYDLTRQLIDIAQPDMVIFEMTERTLNTLGTANQKYIQSLFSARQDGSYLDVYFSDYGFFPQLWFPVWSEENGQDDLNWYRAERLDENTWHVKIDLSKHPSEGSYVMDVYQGTEEPEKYVMTYAFEYSSGSAAP